MNMFNITNYQWMNRKEHVVLGVGVGLCATVLGYKLISAVKKRFQNSSQETPIKNFQATSSNVGDASKQNITEIGSHSNVVAKNDERSYEFDQKIHEIGVYLNQLLSSNVDDAVKDLRKVVLKQKMNVAEVVTKLKQMSKYQENLFEDSTTLINKLQILINLPSTAPIVKLPKST